MIPLGNLSFCGFQELQKKIELIERNHRTEQSNANDQIRKMRKFTNDLQSQLEMVTRNLQVSWQFQL